MCEITVTIDVGQTAPHIVKQVSIHNVFQFNMNDRFDSYKISNFLFQFKELQDLKFCKPEIFMPVFFETREKVNATDGVLIDPKKPYLYKAMTIEFLTKGIQMAEKYTKCLFTYGNYRAM